MTKNDIKGIVFGCILAVVGIGITYGTATVKLGTAYGKASAKIEAVEKAVAEANAKFVTKEVFEITVKNIGKDVKNIGEDIKIIKEDIKIIASKEK